MDCSESLSLLRNLRLGTDEVECRGRARALPRRLKDPSIFQAHASSSV